MNPFMIGQRVIGLDAHDGRDLKGEHGTVEHIVTDRHVHVKFDKWERKWSTPISKLSPASGEEMLKAFINKKITPEQYQLIKESGV